MANLILKTDSYKLTHWNQYPTRTTGVYSYFESREGADYPETVFFGLQAMLRQFLEGPRVTEEDVFEAAKLAEVHLGDPNLFNVSGWLNIVRNHGGRLPLRIRAVAEGTPVPVNNVLMTVENTDPAAYWLTNALESLLTHVWYPSTVASRSREAKKFLKSKLEEAGAPLDGLPFMLHDFGYRGATTDDAAAIGGAGHLLNFMGTDTLVAMEFAMKHYGADLDGLAYSVPATEHSVMTAMGRDGELNAVLPQLLANHPRGILSVVADSYNIYTFVRALGVFFREDILARDGVFVVRPDSVTLRHSAPDQLVVWILNQLWEDFGGSRNQNGLRVLDPHIRVLWGDGIDLLGIRQIVNRAMLAGFSPENLVFGMGGGLLQKLNRDTQRSAFKSSAQERDGEWHDVQKQPLDASKTSKAGRLVLLQNPYPGGDRAEFVTVPERAAAAVKDHDALETVYVNGDIKRVQSFADIRERAAL